MSILIKGIEVPKNCFDCWFWNENNKGEEYCVLTDEILHTPIGERCPIEEAKEKYVKLLPCTCGSKRRDHLYNWDAVTLVCHKCGKKAFGYSEEEAKINWNKMITESKEVS